jgi:hypothetical protein
MFSWLVILCALAVTSSAWKTFIVPHSPDQDDTPALLQALPNFTSDATILFAKGFTYNIFTPVRFPTLTNVEVRVEGNLTYPTDIPTIQSQSVLLHIFTCLLLNILFSLSDIVGSSVSEHSVCNHLR